MVRKQKRGNTFRVVLYGFARFIAIGQVCRIAKVYKTFMWHKAGYGTRNGKAAYARIKNSYGLLLGLHLAQM